MYFYTTKNRPNGRLHELNVIRHNFDGFCCAKQGRGIVAPVKTICYSNPSAYGRGILSLRKACFYV